MKNFYKLFLLLVMSVGLVMIGCGGTPPTATLNATDGAGANIEVTWTNCGSGPFEVTSDTSPLGSFTNVLAAATTDESYTHIAPGSAPVFYKVSGCAIDGMDIIEGGHSTDFSTTSTLNTCYDFAADAYSCIGDKRDVCYPEPADLLGKSVTFTDGSSNDLLMSIDVALGESSYALATLDFRGYGDECTNDIPMTGVHQVPLAISTYDGYLTGLMEYDTNGLSGCTTDIWVLYNMNVVAKDTADPSNYYIGDIGGSTIEFQTWSAPTGTPVAFEKCADPGACEAVACPTPE